MDSTARILVSHSHQDNAWCAAFVAGLRAQGADVWYDEQNLGFGVLRDEIERQMRARPIFIVVLSPYAVASDWVQREVDAAIYRLDAERRPLRKQQSDPAASRVVLPVLTEDCDVPLLWNSFRRVTGPSGAPLAPDEAAERVAQALHIAPLSGPAPVPNANPDESATTERPPAILSNVPEYPTKRGSAGPGGAKGATSDTAAVASETDTTDLFSHAITDLVDEHGTVLVKYPTWLVVTLAASGMIAFLLVGLFGYQDRLESTFTALIFRQPWPLFLWFCALLITLQVSVFRSPLVRQQRLISLGVTVAATVIVIVVSFIYVSNLDVFRLLSQALNLIQITVPPLSDTAWFYTIVNFGVLGGYGISFFVQRAWRMGDWRMPSPAAVQAANEEMPAAKRLDGFAVSSFSGAALALALSLCMQPVAVNLAAALLPSNVLVTPCSVAWPIGTCPVPAGGSGPPSLTLLDLLVALVLLEHGIFLLLVAGPPQGPGAHPRQHFGTLRWVLRNLFTSIVALPRSLRQLLWPALTFFAVFLLADSARNVQTYLHLLSDSVTCRSPAACGGGLTYAAVHGELAAGQLYVAFGLAMLCAILATLCIVFSLAIQVSRGRVARNVLLYLSRFLGRVALLVLTTFWIFALTLSGCIALLNLAGLSSREPFPQPSLATTVSFASAVA